MNAVLRACALILFMASITAGCPISPATEPIASPLLKPRLEFSDENYEYKLNLPDLLPGATHVFKVKFSSLAKRNVYLNRAESGCGCLLATPDKQILARGETTEVDIKIVAPYVNREKKFEKELYLPCGEAEKASDTTESCRITVRIEADIAPVFEYNEVVEVDPLTGVGSFDLRLVRADYPDVGWLFRPLASSEMEWSFDTKKLPVVQVQVSKSARHVNRTAFSGSWTEMLEALHPEQQLLVRLPLNIREKTAVAVIPEKCFVRDDHLVIYLVADTSKNLSYDARIKRESGDILEVSDQSNGQRKLRELHVGLPDLPDARAAVLEHGINLIVTSGSTVFTFDLPRAGK